MRIMEKKMETAGVIQRLYRGYMGVLLGLYMAPELTCQDLETWPGPRSAVGCAP